MEYIAQPDGDDSKCECLRKKKNTKQEVDNSPNKETVCSFSLMTVNDTSYVFNNNSDHRLLLCQFKTPRRKMDRIKFVKKQAKSKMYEISDLKFEYVKSNFIAKVEQLCNMIDSNEVDVNDCTKFVNILEEASSSTLPNAA